MGGQDQATLAALREFNPSVYVAVHGTAPFELPANFPAHARRIARPSLAGLSHGAGNLLARRRQAGHGFFRRAVFVDCLVVAVRILALLIKFTSPGPVFFRQQRSGLNGSPFTLYKFRTMVTNAEQFKHELEAMNEMSGPVFKVTNDPRITPSANASGATASMNCRNFTTCSAPK